VQSIYALANVSSRERKSHHFWYWSALEDCCVAQILLSAAGDYVLLQSYMKQVPDSATPYQEIKNQSYPRE
jgi:hypothetical protein